MPLPLFYPILDTETAARRGIGVVPAAEQIFEAGARILQFRHKGFFSRDVFSELEQIAAIARAGGAILVVNDRADIARMVGAGLHLGQEDLPAGEARRVVGAETMIGLSTHNESQFRGAMAEPVDYIALGPIHATSSKPNPDPEVGLKELRHLRSLTRRPLVAIGGITRANAIAALEAGADSLAIIGDLFPENGNVRGRVEEWLCALPLAPE